MAAQGWITVPGKGKRWRDGSGKLSYMPPLSAGVAALGSTSVENAVLGARNFFERVDAQSQYAGSVYPDPRRGVPGLGADPRIHNEQLSKPQLEALRRGQNEAISGYGSTPGSSLPPAPGLGAPDAYGDPASRAREAEQRRMLQQATPYWEREENQGIRTAAALGGGPRAGESGYAQRADIQAWMEANKNAPKGADGKNIVDRFLEQQQKRGLLDAPGQGSPAFGGERIAMPADSESAVQAGTRGLVGFEGNALAQAQANVSELQGRERAALTQKIFQAAAQGELPDFAVPVPKNIDVAFNRSAGIPGGAEAFTGLEVGQPFTNPEMNRQLASLGQPAAVQAVATGTGSGATLQPSSAAASEAGVEPAQPDAPGNKPNPADDLARRYINNLRTTRAARLGY